MGYAKIKNIPVCLCFVQLAKKLHFIIVFTTVTCGAKYCINVPYRFLNTFSQGYSYGCSFLSADPARSRLYKRTAHLKVSQQESNTSVLPHSQLSRHVWLALTGVCQDS